MGLAGAAVLAATRWLHPSFAAPQRGFRVLDDTSAAVVAALVPVVLATSLPAEREASALRVKETVEAFDRAVSALSPPGCLSP